MGEYIRSGPKGVQGVLAYAALSLSLSFHIVSFFSIFDLIVSPGATSSCRGSLFPPLFSYLFSHDLFEFVLTFLFLVDH